MLQERMRMRMGILLIKASNWISRRVPLVNIILACIDGLIAMAAYLQLLRIHVRNPQVGWTRQKVFHFMIGTANIGYFIYFVLTPIATCEEWRCWLHACGFIVMALPQILFLSAFLLLLSFWVDLCHQANDKEEDEDEDDKDYAVLPGDQRSKLTSSSSSLEKHRRCCSFRCRLHIRSRQKFVIAVVLLICVFTVTFSVLISVGMGRNPTDSSTMAQIYSDLFAIVILISGGGLACYGLLLYLKMSRVRSEKASADIKKVAGLAVVAVVCFTLRSLLVLCTDVPVLNIWHPKHAVHSQSPLLIFLYYVIGSSIPSTFVLWVMREMPPRPVDECRIPWRSLVEDSEIVPENTFVQHWILPSNGQNQISQDHILFQAVLRSDREVSRR